MNVKKQSKTLNRRQIIGFAWAGSIGLLALQWTVSILNFIRPIAKGGFGGEILAGKIAEFSMNTVNRISAGRFFLVRGEDGVLALWQKCTHLGCAVPWVEAEGQFHCPCHGSLYDRHGVVIGGPAPRPLDTFPVLVKNDEIWVDTSKPTERSKFDPSQLTKV